MLSLLHAKGQFLKLHSHRKTQQQNGCHITHILDLTAPTNQCFMISSLAFLQTIKEKTLIPFYAKLYDVLGSYMSHPSMCKHTQ